MEAALISALSVTAKPRLVNVAPGSGSKFAPLGVPIDLADRLVLPRLSLPDLGVLTGGILLTRLAPGGGFKDAGLRRKFDPANLDDKVVAENVVRWWWLSSLVATWGATGEWPKVVAGLAGPPKRRYVAGALEVDAQGTWAAQGPDYEVPVTPGSSLDSHSLRKPSL